MVVPRGLEPVFATFWNAGEEMNKRSGQIFRNRVASSRTLKSADHSGFRTRALQISGAQMRSILVSATTAFHRFRSLDTKSLKSFGVPGAGSLPSARMR